ncbi:MAG: penicillin-binding protein 2 [Desulfobacteraceae bacterium]|jgi:penicillin-binding protein 2
MTNKYLQNVDGDWFRQRLTGVMAVISAAFVVLIVRLFFLQIVEGQEYRRQSEINSIRLQSVDAPRGLVYDRNGILLVDNRPSFDLSIIPKDAKPIEKTLEKLSERINLFKKDLQKSVSAKSGYAYSTKPILIKADIGRDALAALEVHHYELPGVTVDVTPKRQYIYSGSASHLLGYMGEISPEELKSEAFFDCRGGDYVGKFGIEKAFEKFLRGKRGGRQVKVNATGQVMQVLKTVDAQPGHNLFLTIDYRLQNKAEALMADKVGAVVAVDPKTGQILAMVSSPSFDQNSFIKGLSHNQWKDLISNPDHPMENKVIQAEYPPASTFKIVTAIAALEEKVIDEDTVFDCPGYLPFGNRIFRCWRKIGHGSVDVRQALQQSCDVFFYHVGIELGVDRLAWYARACGLGSKTGIDLASEDKGLIPTAAWKKDRIGGSWLKGETLSVAIGQGYNLTTPLQLAMLTAAVGNNGQRLKPLLIKSIKTAGGQTVFESKPESAGYLPVSKKNLKIVQDGLWMVVNDRKGTAYKSKIKGIAMAGKTGTAQVVGRKRDAILDENEIAEHLKPHAWFVSYAPYENPQIAIAVIVEHGEHGSSAAAPIASELSRLYLTEEDKNTEDWTVTKFNKPSNSF